jgi:tripartite motif-containing protein 71
VFDSNGQLKKKFPNENNNHRKNMIIKEPNGLAFNSMGHIIVADAGNCAIKIFSEKLHLINTIALNKEDGQEAVQLSGLAVDRYDSIAVVDSKSCCVYILDQQGNRLKSFGRPGAGNGEFILPWAIAICKDTGRFFVSDFNRHCVQVFSSDGEFLFKIGSEGTNKGQLKHPRGLMLTDCGNYLIVVDCCNHRIQAFNSFNGSFVGLYGPETTAGEICYPVGICSTPSGDIVISLTGDINDVQVFENFVP